MLEEPLGSNTILKYNPGGGEECADDPTAEGCEPIDPGPPPVSPSPTEACTRDINVGNSGNMTSSPANMLADPNGKIIESPESSQFNVLKYGIPSSEYLKVEGQSEKYLTDYNLWL